MDSADVPTAEQEGTEVKAPRDDQAPVIGVPELSHPGESASNGKAEAAVKQVMDMARTLKVALEARIGAKRPLPCRHPVVASALEHTTWILNKYGLNAEGRTPWCLRHGNDPGR